MWKITLKLDLRNFLEWSQVLALKLCLSKEHSIGPLGRPTICPPQFKLITDSHLKIGGQQMDWLALLTGYKEGWLCLNGKTSLESLEPRICECGSKAWGWPCRKSPHRGEQGCWGSSERELRGLYLERHWSFSRLRRDERRAQPEQKSAAERHSLI
jgi:hypothetical protein